LNEPYRNKVERRRNWQALNDYLHVQERHWEDWSFFIEQNTIVPIVGTWELTLSGSLMCQKGIILDVLKVLDINDQHQVLGLDYSYHARISGRNDQPIFRYDNSHVHAELMHPDAFHKHIFSPFTGRELAIEWIGRDYWPFMHEIIEELYIWLLHHEAYLEL